jgi:hypothetical protein
LKHLVNSKLIRLLKLLPPKSFNDFEYWLTAPWSQKNKYFIPFFKILAKAAPNFSCDSLQKEKVYITLYEKNKYDNKIFNNLLLALTKEVERYLAHLQLMQEQDLKQQLLGKVLSTHNELPLFETTTKQHIDRLEKKAAKSTTDHLLLYQLNEALHFQPSGHYRYQTMVPFLEQANLHLDAYFLLEKFKYLQEKVTRTHILQTNQLDIDANTSLLALLNKIEVPLSIPAITLFKCRLNQKKTPDWNTYITFKKAYLSFFSSLHFSFQQLFLFCCINDTLALNTGGHSEAIKELFEWYQLGLNKKLLFQNGKITGGTYNNIILTACHDQKHGFLKDFIANYSKHLPEPIQAQASIWATQQLKYVLEDYTTVVTNLNQWLPSNKIYAIQAKITLLKAHYKLAINDNQQQKSFDSYCLAFERYILRNRLYAKNKRTSYLKYIQYAKKIVRLNYSTKGIQHWERLLTAIDKEPFLIGKQWLKKEIALLGIEVLKYEDTFNSGS